MYALFLMAGTSVYLSGGSNSKFYISLLYTTFSVEYRTRAIIICGFVYLNPLSEGKELLFKELFS